MSAHRRIRSIEIRARQTRARTQYYELSDSDKAYIYSWLIQFLADSTEFAHSDKELRRAWYEPRPRSLPRGRQGQNSVASFVAGIVSTLCRNPDHDLSEPQLEPLEHIFDLIYDFYQEHDTTIETVRFSRRQDLFGL